MEKKKLPEVMILLAHPDFKASRANKALIDAVKNMENVGVENLYEQSGLPFDVESYREKVAAAETLVFQFPFYWAGAPSEMKRWIDEVFTLLARDGSVKGKRLLVVTTAASEIESYRSGGRNRFTTDELLRPYQMAAGHSGMIWQTPFVVYGLRLDERAAEKSAPAYRELIASYAG